MTLILKKQSISEAGSCNYCQKGELVGHANLKYPYNEVFVLNGHGISIRFCESCLKELKIAIDVTLK